MTGVTRCPLGVRGLHEHRDGPLLRIHVVQPVIGADRVRMRRCAGANARTRTRHVRRPRRASHLSSESGGETSTHEDRRKNRGRHCRLRTRHRVSFSHVVLAVSLALILARSQLAVIAQMAYSPTAAGPTGPPFRPQRRLDRFHTARRADSTGPTPPDAPTRRDQASSKPTLRAVTSASTSRSRTTVPSGRSFVEVTDPSTAGSWTTTSPLRASSSSTCTTTPLNV
jgi:hypothetical protein